ncbi:hypothetical protein [Bordetella pertussis]|uniref:hypothetical protein n=1 Tax=Bordetella pertussis TaxID=520 RepID=UPI000AEA75B9|nr:hypothetical protein [Bordetella pertussis]ULX89891.1 hypothetical protein HRK15_08165 [Bordetella pertussis]ULY15114.1 hypothetical protein HRK09_08170 [Bordetella pertussis]ULY38805.1 hypothetical protein HRJ99_08165 [Bordetella pertussis]ULZ21486.1 hypothetical protein HRJ78_08165 [Bordetella pertussis]ULZ25065.1 hypothetical protein HRJ77_08165 [Bordetella pertussis]
MNWGGGDFQFLKSGSDEPCIQPIESSQLGRPPPPCRTAPPARRVHALLPASVLP